MTTRRRREARLLSLVGLPTRAGLAFLPAGPAPGESADRLRAAARVAPGVETVEWSGWRDAVRAELDAVEASPLDPRARLPGAAQVAAGAAVPAQGAVSLAYDRARARN
ncbi:hypothetical protein ACGFZK_12090 [Streptomyces sp. NPDC048257]|uniref:hypothetical protein n=1 Tax=Streptomyces sp. NPDC048257 TaxID=3365526 RepID=UPI0037128008